ncbi:hypothetical protein LSAT2_008699 [Lamellibrachia satsuma]|nr:hypothetical protein LSAT2_008699 [Lamellibrachia satsuma]
MLSTAQPTGLLGNANGLADDDMQTPDGVVIDVNSTSREVFENFGQMCVNHSSFFNPSFEPLFEPPPVDENVTRMCSGSAQCVFDYTVTGKKSLALASAVAATQHQTLVEGLNTVISCGFLAALQNGTKNGTSPVAGSVVTFSCNAGFRLEGSPTRTCSETGSWDGRETTCVADKKSSSSPYDWIIVAILGIFGAVFVVLVLIPFAVLYFCRRRQKSTEARACRPYPAVPQDQLRIPFNSHASGRPYVVNPYGPSSARGQPRLFHQTNGAPMRQMFPTRFSGRGWVRLFDYNLTMGQVTG